MLRAWVIGVGLSTAMASGAMAADAASGVYQLKFSDLVRKADFSIPDFAYVDAGVYTYTCTVVNALVTACHPETPLTYRGAPRDMMSGSVVLMAMKMKTRPDLSGPVQFKMQYYDNGDAAVIYAK